MLFWHAISHYSYIHFFCWKACTLELSEENGILATELFVDLFGSQFLPQNTRDREHRI